MMFDKQDTTPTTSPVARLWEIDPIDLEAVDKETMSEEDIYVWDLIEWVKR